MSFWGKLPVFSALLSSCRLGIILPNLQPLDTELFNTFPADVGKKGQIKGGEGFPSGGTDARIGPMP
jgi:hypothetical protein